MNDKETIKSLVNAIMELRYAVTGLAIAEGYTVRDKLFEKLDSCERICTEVAKSYGAGEEDLQKGVDAAGDGDIAKVSRRLCRRTIV